MEKGNKMNSIIQWLKNYKLIWNLSKNDFTTRYAGSYLGVFWAFVQPMVIVLMYVFVFQVAFHADAKAGGYPYVLWLISGIVPWFFFSEAIPTASNCFLEYSYLVKKVVFPISILPIVKIVSAFFVHAFFVVFSFAIYALMGKVPGIYFVQMLYYLLCIIALITALSFFTSSIVPFFKDFAPIINIIMQIGMWATPILWDVNDVFSPEKDLGWLIYVFKANPMYYIVQGYRDSYMNRAWFWQHPGITAYFWIFTITVGVFGYKSFKKMKPHFADVL